MASESGSRKARFSKGTDTLAKAAVLGLAEKNAAMEGCETHSLVGNLINTPACNILEACQKLLVKESKMSDLSQQNNESTVIAENTDVYLDLDSDNKAQGRITASALQKIHSLPPGRKKKILKIRQQLAESTYDIDDQLNIALDLLIDDLISLTAQQTICVQMLAR